MRRLFLEATDNLYNQVAEQVMDQTEDFTKESGIITCPDGASMMIAKELLEKNYAVDIKPLEENDTYDLNYHLVYDIDESKRGRVKKSKSGIDAGLGGIQFMSDRGSDGAVKSFNTHMATGDVPTSGMAMGESWEEPEEETVCPFCGGHMTFIGGQADYWEFNCDDCGEWIYLDHNDQFHKAEDIWNEDKLVEGWDDIKEGNISRGLKWTLVKEDNYGETFWNDKTKSFDIDFKNKDKASYIFNSADEARKFINNKWPFEIRKNKSYIIMPYCKGQVEINGIEIDSPEHKLVEYIENHDDLNPDLFEGDELKPEVKEKLLDIAKRFEASLEENGIELDVKDIQIVGSNAGYNYNDSSDIDLHLFVDLDVYDDEDLTQKLYDARRQIWNDKYDPTIKGHEVEIYVEPYEEADGEINEAISKGAYSLFNGWVSKPEPEEHIGINIDNELQDKIYYAEHLDTVEEIDEFLDELYKERQDGLLYGGEWSEGNLIFKELRSQGIIQDLKDKKTELLNKEMSLE